MKVYRFTDRNHLSRYAADLIIEQIIQKPDSVLGLATGSTPMDLYARLIDSYHAGEISFQTISAFNLDEYIGLEADHPQSYRRFMRDNLFDAIDILPENTFIPDGQSKEPLQTAQAYDQLIQQSGGIDLQLLGLGTNGHVGFNEPADELMYHTHHVMLDDSTRQANARFFESLDQVPVSALTMGIGSIMSAKRILVLALGENKADAVQRTVEGNITTQTPASLLQLHPNVIVLVDEAAAERLHESSYESL